MNIPIIVTISTGKPKWDALLTKHLNQNKKFRSQARKIAKRLVKAEVAKW